MVILRKEFNTRAFEQLNFNASILAAIKELGHSIDSKIPVTQPVDQSTLSTSPGEIGEPTVNGTSQPTTDETASVHVSERQLDEWKDLGRHLCAVYAYSVSPLALFANLH